MLLLLLLLSNATGMRRQMGGPGALWPCARALVCVDALTGC